MGIVLIFIGFVLVFIGSLLSAQKGDTKVQWAIGGFIGPIPFGAFSNKEMFYVLVGLMIVMLLLFIFFGIFR
jgi:uncharacterized membrane protein